MFQAEHGKPKGMLKVMPRSAASGGQTVCFTEQGQFVYSKLRIVDVTLIFWTLFTQIMKALSGIKCLNLDFLGLQRL